MKPRSIQRRLENLRDSTTSEPIMLGEELIAEVW